MRRLVELILQESLILGTYSQKLKQRAMYNHPPGKNITECLKCSASMYRNVGASVYNEEQLNWIRPAVHRWLLKNMIWDKRLTKTK